MTHSPAISVVVPTFRERENLTELASRLFAALDVANLDAELIIVDDNSGDGTIELCGQLAETYPVRLITRTNARGLATAVIRGLHEAIGEYIVVMDADLSHPPESVSKLLIPLTEDTADFVIGSRYVSGGRVDESWGVFRRLNSRIAGLLAFGLTTAKDPMAGFFAIHKDQLGDLTTLNPCGYKIGLEVMVRCGCRKIVEVPIYFEDRKRGESKLNLREHWLYIQHLFRLYVFRYPELFRFTKFAAVGASGMVVDLLSFRSLLPIVGIGVGRGLAIWFAMTWNFELNRRITFREPQISQRVSQYIRFCTACLLGAGLSWTISVSLLHSFQLFLHRPLMAAAIGASAASIVNYTLCRVSVFGRRHRLTVPQTAASRKTSAVNPPLKSAA